MPIVASPNPNFQNNSSNFFAPFPQRPKNIQTPAPTEPVNKPPSVDTPLEQTPPVDDFSNWQLTLRAVRLETGFCVNDT